MEKEEGLGSGPPVDIDIKTIGATNRTSGQADLLAQNSCTLGYNNLNNLVLLPC
jgi:hypothetical protein